MAKTCLECKHYEGSSKDYAKHYKFPDCPMFESKRRDAHKRTINERKPWQSPFFMNHPSHLNSEGSDILDD